MTADASVSLILEHGCGEGEERPSKVAIRSREDSSLRKTQKPVPGALGSRTHTGALSRTFTLFSADWFLCVASKMVMNCRYWGLVQRPMPGERKLSGKLGIQMSRK